MADEPKYVDVSSLELQNIYCLPIQEVEEIFDDRNEQSFAASLLTYALHNKGNRISAVFDALYGSDGCLFHAMGDSSDVQDDKGDTVSWSRWRCGSIS